MPHPDSDGRGVEEPGRHRRSLARRRFFACLLTLCTAAAVVAVPSAAAQTVPPTPTPDRSTIDPLLGDPSASGSPDLGFGPGEAAALIGPADDRTERVGGAIVAEAATPVFAGGAGVIAGALINGDADAWDPPVVLELAATAMVRPRSLTSSAGPGASVDWDCTRIGESLRCTLVDPDTRAPVAMPAQSIAPWRAVVGAEPALRSGASTAVTVTLDAATPAPVAAVEVTMRAASEDAAEIHVIDDVPALVSDRQRTLATYAVVALGPDTIGSGALRVTGLVPSDALRWSVDSPGWDCAPDAANGSCRWTGDPVAPGGTTGDLVVSFVAPSASVDATRTPGSTAAEQEGDLHEWSTTIEVDGAEVLRQPHTLAVAPPAAPQAALRANWSGAAVATAPTTVALNVAVTGTDLADVPDAIAIEVVSPAGIAFGGQNPEGWNCRPDGEGSGAFSCALDGTDATVTTDEVGLESIAVTLPLTVGADASVGENVVELTAVVPGEPADRLDDNTTTATLVVHEPERVGIEPALFVPGPGGRLEMLDDGAPVTIVEDARLGIGVRNHSSAPVTAGSWVAVRMLVPPGVSIATPSSVWDCRAEVLGTAPLSVGTALSCTTALAADLSPDELLDPAVFTVQRVDRPAIDVDLAVEAELLSGTRAGDADAAVVLDHPATIEPPSADLVVDAEPHSLTPGAHDLRLELSNRGQATVERWSLILQLPDRDDYRWGDLSGAGATATSGEITVDCAPTSPIAGALLGGAVARHIIECTSEAALDAGETITVELPIEVDDGAASGEISVLVDDVDDRGDTSERRSTIPVSVAPPAVATAAASPESIAVDTDVVLLDGRASEGGDRYRWRQVPVPGETAIAAAVTWIDGDDTDGTVEGRVVRFAPPAETDAAVLAFELTVGDGTIADSTVVTIDMEARRGTVTSDIDAAPGMPSPAAARAEGSDTQEPVADDAPTPLRPLPQPTVPDKATGEASDPFELSNQTDAALEDWPNVTIEVAPGREAEADLWRPHGTPFLFIYPYPSGAGSTTQPVGPEYSDPRQLQFWRSPNAVRATFTSFEICNSSGASCSPLPTYTSLRWASPVVRPTAADVGRVLRANYELEYPAGQLLFTIGAEWTLSAPIPSPDYTGAAPSLGASPAALGESFSATPGAWLDSPTSYTYTFSSCDVGAATGCVERQSGTSASYTPIAADAGRDIRMVVEAANANGPSNSGDAFPATAPAFSVPVIEVSPTSVDTAVQGSATGYQLGEYAPSDATVARQWLRCTNVAGSSCSTIAGATGATYTPTAGDVGQYLAIRLTMTTADGSVQFRSGTSRVAGLPPANTVAPALNRAEPIAGTHRLTTTTGTWSNLHDHTTATQFLRCSSAALDNCAPIAGATGTTYDLTPADVGSWIVSEVTITNWDGTADAVAASARSAAIEFIQPAPVATADPQVVVNGAAGASVGSTVSADDGLWVWSTSIVQQWQRCTSATGGGAGCTDISGATSATYTVQPADDGHHLRVVVTATSSGGTDTATSAPVGPAFAEVPTNTVLPQIAADGGHSTVREGMTMRATSGTWTEPATDPLVAPSAWTLQWQRCAADGSNCTDITGATSETFVLDATDVGATVRVIQTVTTQAGVAASATSTRTAAIATGAPQNSREPAIEANPMVDDDLVADVGAWAGWDGAAVTTAVSWLSCDDTLTCTEVSTTASYTPVVADIGHTLSVVVTASNTYGSTEAVSNVSAPVVNIPAPIVTTDVAGGHLDAGAGQTVTIVGSATGRGDITYQWTQLDNGAPTVLSTPGTDPTLTFTTPSTGQGDLVFTLTATQADGQTSDTTVEVHYRQAPVVAIDDGARIDAIGGQDLTLTASGAGIAPLTYVWTQTGGASVLSGASIGAQLTVAPPSVGDASLTFSVEMTDGLGVRTTAEIVVDYTQPVTITTDTGPINVAGDAEVTIVGDATGIAPLTYAWSQVAGEPVALIVDPGEPSTVTIRTPATGIGELTLRLEVTAGNGNVSVQEFVVGYAQPLAAEITPAQITDAVGGASVTLTAVASGVGPLRYEWTQTAGPVVLEGAATSRRLEITPPATGEGSLEFALTVTTADAQTMTRTVLVGYTQPATATIVSPDGRTSVETAERFTLVGSGTALAPTTATWSQVSGPSVLPAPVSGNRIALVAPATGAGTMTFRYEMAGANGLVATADVIVDFAPPPPDPAPPGLCEVIGAVRAPGTSVRLGDRMSVTIGAGRVTTGACDADLSASFSRSTVRLDGVFTLSNAVGIIDRDGVRITAGTLRVADTAFGGRQFSLVGDGLAVDFGDDDFALRGQMVTAGLIGLDAPAGWVGATRLDFSQAPGGLQRIGLEAVAHERTEIDVPTVDGLPRPGRGVGIIGVAGSISGTGGLTLDVRVDNVVRFGSVPVSLTGSVTRPNRDAALTTAVSGRLSTPVELADGVRLDAATVQWADAAVTGTAQVTLGDGLVLDGRVTASSATSWSLDLAAPNIARMALAPGLRLQDVGIAGSLVRSGADTDVELTIAAERWAPNDVVVFDGVSFKMGWSCTAGGCDETLTMGATATVTMGDSSTSGTVTGDIDLETGAYSFTAALGRINPMPGLAVRSMELAVSRDAVGGRDVVVSIDGSLSGTAVAATVEFGPDGWVLRTDVDRITLFPGAPVLRDVSVSYADHRRAAPADADGPAIARNTVAVAATTSAPAWLADLTGLGNGDLRVTGTIDFSTRTVAVGATLADLGGARLVDAPGLAVTADVLRIALAGGAGSPVTGRLGGDVALIVDAITGGGATTIPLTIDGGVSPNGELDASLALRDGVVWSDAFGISDLDVSELAVSLRSGASGMSVGLAGTATLPPWFAEPLGIATNTPVTLAATVGVGPPCYAFEIGDGTATAIDIVDAGIVTATYGSLVVAPSGCRIGPHEYPSGVSAAFTGDVLGTRTDVAIAVDANRGSFAGDISVGSLTIAGLGLDDVTMSADSSPTSQALALSGTATLLGATATVDGAFTRGPSGADMALSGTFTGMDLGGFDLGELEVDITTTNGGADLDISGRGSVDVLGQSIDTDFVFEQRYGRIERATGVGSIDADLGVVALEGSIDVTLERGVFPDITLAGVLRTLDMELSEVRGKVTPTGVILQGSLSIDPVIDARLSGWIAYPHGFPTGDRSPIPAGAAPGDFRLAASNVGIDIAGFTMLGRVEVGATGGETYSRLGARTRLGLGDAFAGSVELDGSFDSDGSVRLTGVGDLTIAGYALSDASFAATVEPDGTSHLGVDAAATLLGSVSTRLGGSLERHPGHGTLFRLYGIADIDAGGFDLADVALLAFRDVPAPGTGSSTSALRALALGQGDTTRPLLAARCREAAASCDVRTGIAGAAQFSSESIGTMDVTLFVTPNGGLTFDGRARLQGALGDALGRPTADISYSLTPAGLGTLGFRAGVNGPFGIPVPYTIDGSLRSDGAFRARATATGGPWTSRTLDLGGLRLRGSASGTFELNIARNTAAGQPIDGSASIRARGRVEEKHVKLNFRWSGWSTVFSTTLDGSTNPLELSVEVDVIGMGTVNLRIV